MTADAPTVPKHRTGIPGFDLISDGGLPRARATLVSGTAGSAKTVFATHFLASGIANDGEPGVFVTFEDRVEDIRANMLGFGWRIADWERAGTWQFVDAAPDPEEPTPVVGTFDLSALLARIEHAVRTIGARRIVLDSLNALFVQFPEHPILRAELFRIITMLKRLGVTVVFTAERIEEYGEVTRLGIEEFVADNVIILRNLLDNERRRRTIEILKLRGAPHQRGEFPFTITSRDGIVVIPLSGMELTQTSSTVRVTSGVARLDEMCNGGFFRDSIVLVSGATGTGKTLLVTQFMAGGFAAGERCLLFAFEESKDQLFRNAAAWGFDFAAMEKDERLMVVNRYPHAMAMEDHLVEMQQLVEDFKPTRVAVDSLSALERVSSLRSFREFVISLTSFLKRKETVGLFTSTTPSLLGGGSVTEKHISTLTDSIILLRYVESYGRMRRAICLLKMRGSHHDSGLREYEVDEHGMQVGEPFSHVVGILSGHPTFVLDGDAGR
ncbi:MAG: circadian clock protein KaiC [Gemmatimonadetes bacterium]|jgi:circadian clock protein KaiC|nr:circadian clock protein KaiC [Gemmatimonadota bacterium]